MLYNMLGTLMITIARLKAWRELKVELDEGRRSGDEHGWINAEEVRERPKERYSG